MVISKLQTIENNTIKNFPVLGTYRTGEKLVILFTELNKGTVVYSENHLYNIGQFSTTWEIGWNLYSGEVTLTNKNGLPITE